MMGHVPQAPFVLDPDTFLKKVRSAKRGAVGGPSGMTVEHLPILEDQQLFYKLAENVAKAHRGHQDRQDDCVAQSERRGQKHLPSWERW